MINSNLVYEKKKLISFFILCFILFLPIETYSILSFEISKFLKIISMLIITFFVGNIAYNQKIKFDFISKFLLFFQLTTLILIPFSGNPEGSMIKWLQYFVISLLYISINQNNYIKKKLAEKIESLIPFLLCVTVFFMIAQLKFNLFWPISVLDSATGTKRAVAFFNNANGLGGFLVVSSIYALWNALTNKKKTYFIWSIIGVLGLYLSDSQGSIIAYGMGALIIIASKRKYIFSAIRYISVCSLILFPFFLLLSEKVQSFFIDVLQSQARYSLWEAAIKIYQDNWIFGIGNYHFSNVVKQYGVVSNYGSSYPHPHNFILDLLVCYGIFGLMFALILLLSILLLFLGKLKVKQNKNYYLITALIVQGLIHDLVDGGYLIGTSSVVIFQLVILAIYNLERND